MRQSGARLAGSMVAAFDARLFSHSATATRCVANGKSVLAGIMNGNASSTLGASWIAGVRNFSAVAQQQQQVESGKPSMAISENEKAEKKEIVSYWGVPSGKIVKKDGTDWRWTCFRVRTYIHH
jgi:hypothetical protein